MRIGGHSISRRRFLAGSLIFGTLLVTGCGDDDSEPTAPAGRMVTHKFGETLVPENPTKVVSVGWDEHDMILTFGIVPIMQRDGWGDQPFGTWPWAQPALGENEPEIFIGDIPYERILALAPDLIMATWAGIDQDTYNRLSEIAPTVAQHPDYDDWETPWDARTIQIGAVFGKEDEARQVISDIEQRINQIRDDHPEWHGLEAVTVTADDGQISIATEGHSRGKLMIDLGFVLPSEIVEVAEGERTVQFSVEQMQIVDRDVIVWVNGSDDSSNIADLPLRTTLNAHLEGREVYCDKVLTAAFSIQSPLSYGYLLDVLVPEIEAAVDGDPATEVTIASRNGIAP